MLVKLKPALKNYIWAGKRLARDWGKGTPGEDIAEAWELSFHPDGPALIAEGEYRGRELRSVARAETWGRNCARFAFFPVLTKFIDAASPLSIQVHPSDGYALLHEGQYGKTEMWHILGAEEGACIYLGLKEDVTRERFAAAVAQNAVCGLLNKIPVHAGETYFIPSGTLHAVGRGVTLFEIQENSSLTYRVYDYGRVDATGNPRALHVEKALEVLNYSRFKVRDSRRGDLLGACPYFSVYSKRGSGKIGREDSYVSVTVLDGTLRMEGTTLSKGETAFLSAGTEAEAEGDAEYILVFTDRQ